MKTIIFKILKTENTIILPNFGALLKIGEGFQFNKFLKYNDGKLISFVEKEFSLSTVEAKEKVNAFIEDVKKELASKGEFEIQQVGILKQNGEKISVLKTVSPDNSSDSIDKVETKEVLKTPKVKEVEKKETKQAATEKKSTDKPIEKVVPEAKKKETPIIIKEVDSVEKPKEKVAVKKEVKESTVDKKEKSNENLSVKAEVKKTVSTTKEIKKEVPVVEQKRKKKFPIFLIILLLLLFILGGAGYYFKSHVTNYYHSAQLYITGHDKSVSGKDLTSDGSKNELLKKENKNNNKSEPVSEKVIESAEEDYVGDSKVEGDNLVDSENSKEKSDHLLESKLISENISESKVNDDNSSIEDLKNELAESIKVNKENSVIIKDLNTKIASLEQKLKDAPSMTNSNSISSSSNGKYKVVVGSFSKRSYAEKKVEELKSNGYNNSYVVGRFGGLYIVSLSDFDSKSEANSLKEKYKSSGGSAFVKKV